MAGQQCTGRSISSQHLKDTRRKTSFLDQRQQSQRSEWCLLRWFEDEAVASSKRRASFETNIANGSVPWHDARSHTQWLIADDLQKAVLLWVRLARELVGPSGVVAKCFRAKADLKAAK